MDISVSDILWRNYKELPHSFTFEECSQVLAEKFPIFTTAEIKEELYERIPRHGHTSYAGSSLSGTVDKFEGGVYAGSCLREDL